MKLVGGALSGSLLVAGGENNWCAGERKRAFKQGGSALPLSGIAPTSRVVCLVPAETSLGVI